MYLENWGYTASQVENIFKVPEYQKYTEPCSKLVSKHNIFTWLKIQKMLWKISLPICPPTSDSPAPQENNVINAPVYACRGILSMYKQMHANTFFFFVQLAVYSIHVLRLPKYLGRSFHKHPSFFLLFFQRLQIILQYGCDIVYLTVSPTDEYLSGFQSAAFPANDAFNTRIHIIPPCQLIWITIPRKTHQAKA